MKRFSMLVDDGVVKQLNVEEKGKFEVSDAATMLKQLALAPHAPHTTRIRTPRMRVSFSSISGTSRRCARGNSSCR
jgi:hypothetical protein